MVGLVLAFGFNFAMYWFSDKIAIATTRSKPVAELECPTTTGSCASWRRPRTCRCRSIYVSDMAQPNAFATGRNPEHAAVSVTTGILQILDERELRGVLAHELSHVANRDILIASIAAGIGMSITFLARLAFLFGGSNDNRGGGGTARVVLAPLAAAIIQMAVSRSREYQADESGAYLSHDPEALASALQKLEDAPCRCRRRRAQPRSRTPVHREPVGRRSRPGMLNLFSTHPPTAERVERLQAIGRELRGGRSHPLRRRPAPQHRSGRAPWSVRGIDEAQARHLLPLPRRGLDEPDPSSSTGATRSRSSSGPQPSRRNSTTESSGSIRSSRLVAATNLLGRLLA